MSELLQSARWKLPMLAVGQMQKEVTHNEALALVDVLIAPVVEAGGVNDPPPAPLIGQCWLVGATPTGAWTGAAQHLACWTSGGWRLLAPRAGQSARVTAGAVRHFDGSAWLSPGHVATPAGGTIVDSEARAAIAALVDELRLQGLLEPF